MKNSLKNVNGGTLLGMFIGLVMGVLLTCGVILYLNNAPLPFNVPGQNMSKPSASNKPVPKPNAQKDENNRFSFYEILPNKNGPSASTTASPPTIYVQKGAFSRSKDADNQKAQIALMGLEAQIQQIIIKNKTLYRVRLGPFNEKDAKIMQGELMNAGISAQLVP